MLVASQPSRQAPQQQFEVRLAGEPGNWVPIAADWPEEAAARFVQQREQAARQFGVASGEFVALVIVRLADNVCLSASYSVGGKTLYFANVIEPGRSLPAPAITATRA